jgi:hypothetical protein
MKIWKVNEDMDDDTLLTIKYIMLDISDEGFTINYFRRSAVSKAVLEIHIQKQQPDNAIRITYPNFKYDDIKIQLSDCVKRLSKYLPKHSISVSFFMPLNSSPGEWVNYPVEISSQIKIKIND